MVSPVNSPELPARLGALRYLAVIVVTFASFTSIILLALIRLAAIGPTPHSSESSRWIYALDQRKRELTEAVRRPKIQIIGGSGALYSVRAKQLEARLGIPVINNALHAGLGVDYLLHRAQGLLGKGDIALLMLEYDLYLRKPAEWPLADFVLPYDLGYLDDLDMATRRELAARLTPNEYGFRVYDAVMGEPVDVKHLAATIDRHGALLLNRRTAQNDAHRAGLDAAKALPLPEPLQGPMDPRVPQSLPRFIAWCREHGVGLIAGFPAFLDFPVYGTPAGHAYLDSVVRYLKESGIVTLGVPRDFMFPKALFFDTPYHMHDVGADRMTAAVADRLRGILAERSPAVLQSDTMRLPVAPPLVIDLSEPGVPAGVDFLEGFGERESWGRWTDGPQAKIVLASPLPLRFRLTVDVRHAFGRNASDLTSIRIGDQQRSIHVVPGGDPVTIEFSSRRPGRTIVIVPSHPDSPKALGRGEDSRRLGVGLSLVSIEAIIPSDGGEGQPSHGRR